MRGKRFEVASSQANFVWLPMTARTRLLVSALGEDGLSVRVFGEEGVRVTVGEPEAVDRLLKAASAV